MPGSTQAFQAATEAEPLKEKKEKGYMDWWNNKATPTFKFALVYSIRVSLWAVMISVVPLAFHNGRAFFAKHGFNAAYIVCNFLFTIGPNVGTTIQNSLYGLIGNLWAALMLYVLNGFFPGGFQGDNSTAFWVGLVCSILFILFFMYFNVNANVQFFALYGYIGYAMTFLDPTSTAHVSEAFTLSHKGTAVNAVILFAIGAAFAILCSLLPWPVTARSLMLKQIGQALDDVLNLYRQIVEYYVGNSAHMEIYELMSNVHGIRGQLAAARGSIGAAWFECFGLGSHARSRQMMIQIITAIEEALMYVDPLLSVVSREGFERTHAQMVDQIRPQLLSVLSKTEALFKFCLSITKDGQLSPNERAICEQDLADLDASVNALIRKMQVAARTVSADMITTQTTGENFMVYTATRIADKAEKRARGLLAGDHPGENPLRAISDDFKAIFDRSVILSKDHLMWVFRNTLSLTLCFWLGYFGWSFGCTEPGRTCFIRPYNASMATLVIVLLSKFIGSTFKNALDRLTAVVLANVVGQLCYVLVGWCTLGGRIWTGIFVFFIVVPGMYVAYSPSSYASIGMRLAAIGAMSVLAPCSDNYITHSQYADQYHAISDIVIGASIMLLVDMIFGGKPAGSICRDKMIDGMNMYRDIFHDLSTGKPKYQQLKDRLATAESIIASAGSMSEDAGKEPRFWRQKWRPSLCSTIVTGFRQLAKLLQTLLSSLDEDKEHQAMMERMHAYERVLAEIDSSLGFTIDLSTYILHLDRPDEMVGLTKMLHQAESESLPLDDLVAQMNQQSVTVVQVLRSCEVVENITSIMKQLRNIQHQVVFHKGA
jgi:hypothetical protein